MARDVLWGWDWPCSTLGSKGAHPGLTEHPDLPGSRRSQPCMACVEINQRCGSFATFQGLILVGFSVKCNHLNLCRLCTPARCLFYMILFPPAIL